MAPSASLRDSRSLTFVSALRCGWCFQLSERRGSFGATIAEPVTQEMLDTGIAFAGTHVKTVIEKMFNERNNSLSNRELAQAFEQENISLWEKTMIEGLLIDRHEDENSEEEHDAVLEKDDPIAAIVKNISPSIRRKP